MRSKDIDSFKRAKNYAFLLLKFRLRSEKEIYQRLKRKNFSEEIIKKALVFLKEKNFIDDALFAGAWIESRIKKPLGLRRLKEELRQKGVDEKIIRRCLEEAGKNYPQQEIAANIARERFNKSKNIEPQKAKRRIFAYLLRRGFSYDVVMEALNQL